MEFGSRRPRRAPRSRNVLLASLLVGLVPYATGARGGTSAHPVTDLACPGTRADIPLAPCFVPADTLFACDFESGSSGCGGWSASNGLWSVGAPCAPPSPHGGVWCAGAMLCGNYTDNITTRFSTVTPIPLPALAADERLRLRFWHWYRFSAEDAGWVEIRAWRGTGWGPWKPVRGGDPAYTWYSPVWTSTSFDLTSYADSTVQIGFLFKSVNSYGSVEVDRGWVVDDVSLVRGSLSHSGCTLVESFENGLGSWSVDGGHWEVGAPTSGPSSAHGGSNLAGTVLDGNYQEYVSSRLISPALDLPSLEPCEKLRLRYWHWYRISAEDWGRVEIRTWRGTGWGSWQAVRGGDPTYLWYSPTWTSPSIDLTTYADSTVQIGFHFVSQNSYGSWEVDVGWYVDDVRIVKGVEWASVEYPGAWETFETGIGDWGVDGGHWEVGAPTAGPSDAHSGTGVAGTILSGPYSEYADTRLIMPPVQLGTDPFANKLCFYHWFRIAAEDWGNLVIRIWSGAQWGPWQTMQDSPTFQGISASWTSVCVLLPTYAGQKVQIGFRFYSTNSYGSWETDQGWFIDDVQMTGVVTDAAPAEPKAPQRTMLHANVPNPFNPSTVIRYDLSSTENVRLTIFDVSGKEVRRLVDEPRKAAGRYTVHWDGLDRGGSRVASGVYVCALQTSSHEETRRLVLVR